MGSVGAAIYAMSLGIAGIVAAIGGAVSKGWLSQPWFALAVASLFVLNFGIALLTLWRFFGQGQSPSTRQTAMVPVTLSDPWLEWGTRNPEGDW